MLVFIYDSHVCFSLHDGCFWAWATLVLSCWIWVFSGCGGFPSSIFISGVLLEELGVLEPGVAVLRLTGPSGHQKG